MPASFASGWPRAFLVGLFLTLACGAARGADDAAFRHGQWPFFPPERPAIPDVQRADWAKNPIDQFILAKLEEAGLQPSPPAEKLTLLRRVTFDLTGLPPTVAEQEAFLADTSPEAYDKVVDRLLASPHYGERWAQYWLDLVRYAESDGFKEDALRPDAHKYRDYVIRAFNADLPYDQFVRQQLAGDELEPDNPDAIIATGLNRLYPDETNAANVQQRRQEILDDITDTTGLVFMGLTMGCAQCHDHKFDEILQTDYYRLQAFFTPMLPRRDLTAATPEQRRQFQEQQQAWEQATASVREQIAALVEPRREQLRRDAADKFDAEIKAAIFKPEAERTALQRQYALQAELYLGTKLQDAIVKLNPEEKKKYDELAQQLGQFDNLKPQPLPLAMAVTDAGCQPPPTFRLATGNFRRPQEEVTPGFPDF